MGHYKSNLQDIVGVGEGGGQGADGEALDLGQDAAGGGCVICAKGPVPSIWPAPKTSNRLNWVEDGRVAGLGQRDAACRRLVAAGSNGSVL